MVKRKLLVLIDVQNDFIDGSLGSIKAQETLPNIVEKLRNWKGFVMATKDTHDENYLQTNEGKNLPVPHCIKGTKGWDFPAVVESALTDVPFIGYVEKESFGFCTLWNGRWKKPLTNLITNVIELDEGDDCNEDKGINLDITLVGYCTDICVVSNALMLKAAYPEATIRVDSKCCAGTTPERHNAALEVMRSCQIIVE